MGLRTLNGEVIQQIVVCFTCALEPYNINTTAQKTWSTTRKYGHVYVKGQNKINVS